MRHHVVAGDVFHDERDGAIEGVEELGAIEAEELVGDKGGVDFGYPCLLYTSPSPRDS